METWGALDKAEAMKRRTKMFALGIIYLFKTLPKQEEARVMGRQLLRSGTGVAANYRAVCRARTRREFISKMNIVVEEADETVFWLELLVEAKIVSVAQVSQLVDESRQLLAICAASLYTAKTRQFE